MNRHHHNGKTIARQADSAFSSSRDRESVGGESLEINERSPRFTPSRFHLSDVPAFLFLMCLLTTSLPVDAKGATRAAAKKETTWTLDQISDEAGRGQLVVNQRGVRIKMKSLTAIVTSPKFDAIIFDTSTKKFIELPYKKWSEKYKDKNPLNITESGHSEKIAGLNTKGFNVPSKKVAKEVWFTKDIPVSEEMCRFISTTMHLPGGHGMPVRMEVTRGRGKERLFDTLKYSKSDKADPKLFDKPVGFKRVDSEYQLFVKEDTVKDMGGFLQ